MRLNWALCNFPLWKTCVPNSTIRRAFTEGQHLCLSIKGRTSLPTDAVQEESQMNARGTKWKMLFYSGRWASQNMSRQTNAHMAISSQISITHSCQTVHTESQLAFIYYYYYTYYCYLPPDIVLVCVARWNLTCGHILWSIITQKEAPGWWWRITCVDTYRDSSHSPPICCCGWLTD